MDIPQSPLTLILHLPLHLQDLIDEAPAEKLHRRDAILRRLAFYEFTQHKFEDSLRHYLAIKEDPVTVIGLYPGLLPTEIRQSLAQTHPTRPPTLTGDELEEGMKHLITYLTQVRSSCPPYAVQLILP